MTKFRMQGAIDQRTNRKIPLIPNCDTLVEKIQKFFVQYEAVISLKDQQKLLKMLKIIEKNNKCVPNTEKQAMYDSMKLMAQKYKIR